MTRKRKRGNLAVIGGLTAVTALLTAFSAVRADELADLRANQQLLQQRIDQLAQAQAQVGGPSPGASPAYGTTAVPGTGMVGGNFPRSFLIPGTDTSIRVGGFADLTIDYWLQNGPPNNVQSTTVGVNGNLTTQPLFVGRGRTVPGYPTAGNLVPVQIGSSRGNGVFLESPRESRLNVETRTPTAYGEARTFIEFDFAGTNNFSATGQGGQTAVSDNLIPRLRYAYGTLGGFLAGQANSNFEDSDANPETLDFGGPAGEAGVVRIPQVRYTLGGPYGSAFSVSAETPETDIFTPAGKITSDSTNQVFNTTAGLVPASNGGTGSCVANGLLVTNAAGCTLGANPTKASAPDVTFSSYFSQPWGHVDARFVVRPTLQINDGRYVNQRFVGYGGGLSGDVKPGWFGYAKDDFQWQFTVGNGIGRYINDSTNAGLATNYMITPATPAAAAAIIVKPVMEAGGTVGYQHWWLPNVRSNLVYGFAMYDIASQLIGPVESTVANRQLQTIHANVIWSPVAFIDTGVEYMWGQRRVVANIYGQEQAIIGKFRVKF